jgi:N-acetylmuramoyl-L-alanine amidase
MIIVDAPSPNFDERGRAIDLLILHYTGMETAEIAIDRLRDQDPRAGVYALPGETPEDPSAALGRVSAHYVVEEGGRILRLVADDKRAWHAGAGEWAGESDLNARAIGVEIVNGGHDFGLPDYPDRQIAAVIELVADITARHRLRAHQVVGHSDVAPARKADPGEKFPWKALASARLALWPRTQAVGAASSADGLSPGDGGPRVRQLQAMLAEIGYGLSETGEYDADTEMVVRAFQRRFRPIAITGEADPETTALATDILDQTRRLMGAGV